MGVKSFAPRCRWYLRALGRNPLIRIGDRVEAFSVLAVLVMAIAAIQLAAQVGATTYDAQMRTVHEQAHDRQPVQALVVDGNTSMAADFDDPGYVRAQWREGTRLRTEQVISTAIVEAGAPLTVWLDQNGKVVAAPLKAADAKVTSIAVEWTVWVMCVVLSLLGALAVRTGLDTFRARNWERELRLLAGSDDGWANRHP